MKQLRLSSVSIAHLPETIIKPSYDRKNVKAGIVHLGIGAFHRAHQAVYTDDVLQQSSDDWGIIGVSLRSPDTRDALLPQNGLYTIVIRDGEAEQVRVISSVIGLLVAPEEPHAVLDVLCDEDIKIVSLTITEKGYCYAAAKASLDEDHPDIIHDLQNPASPRSAPGFIVEALRRRRLKNFAPFTLLSCDNLPANGDVLKRVIIGFASLCDQELADYIEESVAFPSTMVDRIVPATTDEDRQALADNSGVIDAWPVMTEPFSQWVVEDHFTNGRPLWEKSGVTFVEDVSAFELMKLRLLNGSHSTIAYLGYLAGHETVSDVMQAEGFSSFIRDMMDQEITPTLPILPDFDLGNYKDQLIKRFQNTALKHRTWQIAMDGSQKLPQRLLAPARERIQKGMPIDRLAMGIAGWMRYVMGEDEHGHAIDVRDPLLAQIRAHINGYKSPAELVAGFCMIDEVISSDLAQNTVFREAVEDALSRIMRLGAGQAVSQFRAS
ncbi:mannitol dehydrogenase family protein [Brucellaceae bacterium C25G]